MSDATHLDPPDAETADCNWCGNDPRPTAFCCAACENASRIANEQPFDQADESEQRFRVTLPEHDLLWLAARGR